MLAEETTPTITESPWTWSSMQASEEFRMLSGTFPPTMINQTFEERLAPAIFVTRDLNTANGSEFGVPLYTYLSLSRVHVRIADPAYKLGDKVCVLMPEASVTIYEIIDLAFRAATDELVPVYCLRPIYYRIGDAMTPSAFWVPETIVRHIIVADVYKVRNNVFVVLREGSGPYNVVIAVDGRVLGGAQIGGEGERGPRKFTMENLVKGKFSLTITDRLRCKLVVSGIVDICGLLDHVTRSYFRIPDQALARRQRMGAPEDRSLCKCCNQVAPDMILLDNSGISCNHAVFCQDCWSRAEKMCPICGFSSDRGHRVYRPP